jgi:phospholipid/cholesterol/gamma-HCH transport system substrate-binding protein
MKRIATVALLLSLAAAAVLTTGAGDGGSYKVRAIFDNAGFVIPGEDVKVAGVKVGKVDSMDVTPDFKAVVVLDIQDPAYQDFRTDARCQVRPQSLIGERFVECTPTQKHAVDTEPPPALRQIERGKGKGQYLLPVTNTEQSVDLDLINNVMRLPYRERLTVILSELGTGLAGRGTQVNQVIRRADPALREVDQVLRLLASQNKVLADLARDSDTVLAPLARERRHVSGFIRHSSSVAQATAERGDALEADIEKFPRFLAELTPTMRRLGGLADAATPVFADLGDVAPDINRMIIALGPFSVAGIPAVKSLGDASVIGTPAVKDALPVTKDLRQLAAITKPVAATASTLLQSFKKGQGVQRLLDYIFYQVAAVNGFDKFGHYLRARLILNTCSRYYTTPVDGCLSKFSSSAAQSSSATAASAAGTDPILRRTTAALQGKNPDSVAALPRPEASSPLRSRQMTATPQPTPEPSKKAAPAPAPAATPAPANAKQGEAVLDYLFGKDAG